MSETRGPGKPREGVRHARVIGYKVYSARRAIHRMVTSPFH